MKDVVIVGAVRTPIGCFQGALARHSAVELGSLVIQALVDGSGISAAVIDEVIIENSPPSNFPQEYHYITKLKIDKYEVCNIEFKGTYPKSPANDLLTTLNIFSA